MKLNTFLMISSAAIAWSSPAIVPDSGDNAWDMSTGEVAMPPPGPAIPGQNTLNLCKGDHSHDAVCIELQISPYLSADCKTSRTHKKAPSGPEA